MNNIFASLKQSSIKQIYDLKGSLHKRYIPADKVKTRSALKDLNFLENRIKFLLNESKSKELLNQLQNDVEFLGIQKVMDYSLLVGITENRSCPSNYITSSKKNIFSMNSSQLSNLSVDYVSNKHDHRVSCDQFLPFSCSDSKNTYFFGIIDTLTFYNWKKKSEYFFKRLFINNKISCIPPSDYQFRFYNFITP